MVANSQVRMLVRVGSALACAGLLAAPAGAQQMLVNPSWEIALTSAGYSDYLGDLTPAFLGREYLSGEWGGAVGYRRNQTTVAPTWLEPNFIFPDWTTNSTFGTIPGGDLSITGTNAAGLPIAASSLSNGVLRVDQRFEMLDTVFGTPLGTSPASAGGAGSFLLSNRYVLRQSYSFLNQSADTLTDLQFFQLLHGLNSQTGVYDNRLYPGALSNYRYAVTLRGRDDTAQTGQYDYITFKSALAPSAWEIGAYGIEGTDSHVSDKPGDGVHLSIESNWSGAYASRNGVDNYAPAARWVAGGQRWNLGSLAPGQSAALDVLLAIRTGWVVGSGEGTGGSINGGSTSAGGVDYEFERVGSEGGTLFASYEALTSQAIAEWIAEGKFGAPTFQIPGSRLQTFEVEFEGSFSGTVRLTFGYDANLLPDGFDEGELRVFHWRDGQWEDLGGTVDPIAHTITAYTDSLSPFAVAAVPEPESYALMLVGAGLVAWRLRRRRGLPAGAGSSVSMATQS